MSFLDKLKARTQEVADMAAEKMKEFTAPVEVTKRRIEICNECPSLIKLTNTCKECGCFMTAKTKLKDVTCPLNKW